ncbi:MAG: amidohydrolase [Acidimicrobiia bacterium]|nr:amidohydrolase [Acidimicrobiia bacterium]
MPDRISTLARLAAKIAPEMIEVRRDIHQHPEVGWMEHRTTSQIAKKLLDWDITPHVRPEGTGLVANIGNDGPAVGFRADLDALPIAEEAAPPYASVIPGVMHACGHDAHAAIGLGAAWVLQHYGDLPGTARFIFQPAEETIPGGAQIMRDDGVHRGLTAITAFHVDPSLEAGRVGIRSGGITGASDRFYVRLSGPGGHTSRPHQTVNLLYVAARIITDVPQMIRHTIDPRETVLVVFGSVQGGTAANVIPTHVELQGTVRLFDLDLWREMPKRMESLIADMAGPLGATAEVEYVPGSPPVVNDESVIRTVEKAAEAALGRANVVHTHQSLGAEDFAWFLEDVPGALIRLGAALPNRAVDLHSATFDIDESAIETGILVASETMLRLLESAAATPT